VRPDQNKVYPHFLLYAYLAPEFQATLQEHKVLGSTVERLFLTEFRSLPIVLPPMPEQRAIADILGALDDKIDSNRRCVLVANAVADSLYACLEASLEHRTLGALREAGALTFSDGYRTRGDQLGEPGLPILRVADMKRGLLRPTGDHVKSVFLRGNEAKLSAVGDVVISTKGTVGRVVFVSNLDTPVVYSPQVCFIRVRDGTKLSPSLIHRWARSSSFATQAASFQRQTDMAPYINLADFALLEVPLGGTDQPVAAEIELMDSLVATLERESVTLAALRDALLPELLSGRLRVPEARERVEAVV
jgi:type I restriction enzyme S subunit